MEKKRYSKEALVHAVKAYAYRHYESGWDIVVECYTDEEILAAIGRAVTETGAIKSVNRNLGVSLHYERLREIESFIF